VKAVGIVKAGQEAYEQASGFGRMALAMPSRIVAAVEFLKKEIKIEFAGLDPTEQLFYLGRMSAILFPFLRACMPAMNHRIKISRSLESGGHRSISLIRCWVPRC